MSWVEAGGCQHHHLRSFVPSIDLHKTSASHFEGTTREADCSSTAGSTMGGGASRATTGAAPETPRRRAASVAETGKTTSFSGAVVSPRAAASAGSVHSNRGQEKAETAIDQRIVQTLRELNMSRRQTHTKVKAMNFERIALRFGMARDAFSTIHSIYSKFADPVNGLNYEGLKAVLVALGADMQENDVRDIFYESDMVRDNSLSHNEFVISLAISHLLGLIPSFGSSQVIVHSGDTIPREDGAGTPRDLSLMTDDSSVMIAKTLDLVVNAYLLFDEDGSGTIQINEVRQVMQKHNETSNRKHLTRKASGMSTQAIRAERIKELDLNSDGTITFQEFVLTFQKWVGVDEGGEEDEG